MNDFLLSFGLTVGVSLLVSIATAFSRPASRLDWLLSALLCGGVAVYMVLVSPIWAWIGFDWRPLPLVAAGAAILWSARRLRGRPALPPRRPRTLVRVGLRGTVAALIAGMLVHLHLARALPPGAVDLSFPLQGGRYVVLHGGGATSLNYHRVVPAQAWATDVLALDDEGRRARGVRPEALDAYEIFDHAIVAPCDGVVSRVWDGAPDVPIGEVDAARPAGNHVLLSCVVGGADLTVLLAHLRSGSVAVAEGEPVRRGARLGRVGNSGNSTEPHLHVHAVRGHSTDPLVVIATGEAVPLTFGGRFLARNAVIHADIRAPGPPK